MNSVNVCQLEFVLDADMLSTQSNCCPIYQVDGLQ